MSIRRDVFRDKVVGYVEALRVLKPGGKFIVIVWDHIGVNEFVDIVRQTASAEFLKDQQRFLAWTSQSYNGVSLIQQELSATGYSGISISTMEKRVWRRLGIMLTLRIAKACRFETKLTFAMQTVWTRLSN
jgi:hypothetical protein